LTPGKKSLEMLKEVPKFANFSTLQLIKILENSESTIDEMFKASEKINSKITPEIENIIFLRLLKEIT
jgi:hypothetical protein